MPYPMGRPFLLEGCAQQLMKQLRERGFDFGVDFCKDGTPHLHLINKGREHLDTLKPDEVDLVGRLNEMVIDLRLEESISQGKPDCAFCAGR